MARATDRYLKAIKTFHAASKGAVTDSKNEFVESPRGPGAHEWQSVSFSCVDRSMIYGGRRGVGGEGRRRARDSSMSAVIKFRPDFETNKWKLKRAFKPRPIQDRCLP